MKGAIASLCLQQGTLHAPQQSCRVRNSAVLHVSTHGLTHVGTHGLTYVGTHGLTYVSTHGLYTCKAMRV